MPKVSTYPTASDTAVVTSSGCRSCTTSGSSSRQKNRDIRNHSVHGSCVMCSVNAPPSAFTSSEYKRVQQAEDQGGYHDALQQGAQTAWTERVAAAEHPGQHDEHRHAEGPGADVVDAETVVAAQGAADGVQDHDQRA